MLGGGLRAWAACVLPVGIVLMSPVPADAFLAPGAPLLRPSSGRSGITRVHFTMQDKALWVPDEQVSEKWERSPRMRGVTPIALRCCKTPRASGAATRAHTLTHTRAFRTSQR